LVTVFEKSDKTTQKT